MKLVVTIGASCTTLRKGGVTGHDTNVSKARYGEKGRDLYERARTPSGGEFCDLSSVLNLSVPTRSYVSKRRVKERGKCVRLSGVQRRWHLAYLVKPLRGVEFSITDHAEISDSNRKNNLRSACRRHCS